MSSDTEKKYELILTNDEMNKLIAAQLFFMTKSNFLAAVLAISLSAAAIKSEEAVEGEFEKAPSDCPAWLKSYYINKAREYAAKRVTLPE